MAEKSSGSAESSKEGPVADVTADDIRTEISGLLKRSVEPVQAGESIKALIRRAAFRLNLSPGRAKRLWYEEAALIPAHEADTIRRRFEVRAKQRAQVRGMEDEIQDLKRRLQALEGGNDGSASKANGCCGDATGVDLARYGGHR